MNTVQIVGILNTTPDSYFDGGKYDAVSTALSRAKEMKSHGADIIEIGGQSTGPGSIDVSLDEELSRTIPIIKMIKEEMPDCVMSIDTYVSDIAKEAIAAGVSMINDVTAGRGSDGLFEVVANTGVQLVLMYAKDSTPRTTVEKIEYEDIISTIKSFLLSRIEEAKRRGVASSSIIIDPGMGHFISSDPVYSFEVIRRLSELSLIAPIFVSPSRKSFLAGPEKLPPEDRLPVTIAASLACVTNGASYLRTHDVQEISRALQTQASIQVCR